MFPHSTSKFLAALCVLGLAAAIALAAALARGSSPGDGLSDLPTVAVVRVVRKDLFKELTIQAEFRPYLEVELHAKVAGYLERITVDFGDLVKAGDLIATLEVPELKAELDQAVATEQRAEADQHNAELDYGRLQGVNRSQPNLIAQQDLDTAQAKQLATTAAVAAAKADAEKYRTLLGYTRITAPFDGVVTARYADPGALIQTSSTSSTQLQTLIRLSENQRLRLDFPVSVSYAQDIAVGDQVEVRLENSRRVLQLPVTRFTRRVAMDTRTMATEVEVPNSDLAIIPGMYATVMLHVEKHPHALAIPVEAIGSSASPTAYVVNQQGQIEERSLKLGVESSTDYEVLAGVAEGDLVMVGSRADVHPGEKVRTNLLGPSPTP
jgi:RND family efflux transporter MFP subunit